MDNMLLSLLVFLPVAAAGLMLAVPGRIEKAHKWIALGVSALMLGLGIDALVAFDRDLSGPQFEVDVSWVSLLDIRYHVFVDGISLPLLLLSILITGLCVVYCCSGKSQPDNFKAFTALMLTLETGVNGALVAQDLILFFVFFEVVLLPMYFLVGVWGGERRQYAAIKFFVYTVLGSALMLISFLGAYFLGDGTFDIPELVASGSGTAALAHGTQMVLFGALFFGLAVKVPLFPFHTWMPDAHTEAPTAASVLLAAVMLKLGAYGFIRIAIPMYPDAAKEFAPWIGLLAVIGIIYGALGCFAQRDLKRLIAFSSLSHMGFVMLAIATLTDLGVNAAIFAMVAHGLITGMLFFLSGSVHQRLGTRELDKLGGLLAVAPHLTWILGFCAMASLGLPGLAGFWGEFGSILSAFSPSPHLPLTVFRVYMVLAAVGTVLGAGYLLWMYQRIAFGNPTETVKAAKVSDITKTELLSWAPLIVLIAVLGVLPAFVFDITGPAAAAVMSAFG